MTASDVTIPKRPVFRPQEVCELADVQPYVLRTWEAEFPELGVSKSPTSPRVYRRADVERVLRIKNLLFVDGLTLAGARRRLTEEGFGAISDDATPPADADVAAMINGETQQQLRDVRRGLQWILGVLSGEGLTAVDYVLRAEPAVPARPVSRAKAATKPLAKISKPARSSRPKLVGKANKRKR